MKEHHLYPGILIGTDRAGWKCFRINDGSFGKKPFDIAGVDSVGRGVAIEVKVSRNKDHDKLIMNSRVTPHQEAWLKLYRSVNAISLLLIYRTQTKEMAMYFADLTEDNRIIYRAIGLLVKKDKAWIGFEKLYDRILEF